MTWWTAVAAAVGVLALAARKPREWTAADVTAEQRWRARMLAERRCPDSGMALGGPVDLGGEQVLVCSICDCFGYKPEEVGGGAAS